MSNTAQPSTFPRPAGADERRKALDDLEEEITELAAHINAATYRWLCLVGEFDRREGWGGVGILSCAHWLNWKCGIDLGAAREKVRVARRLAELPQISEAFRCGELSYSKVRAMTRVATPENEKYLLYIARHGTASHVEKLVRKYRRGKAVEENEHAQRQHARRALHWYWDDDGSLVVRGRLPPEEGALVLEALQATKDELFRDEDERRRARWRRLTWGVSAETSPAEEPPPLSPLDPAEEESTAGADNPPAARNADALVRIAETLLAGGLAAKPGAERHLITVHVDARALAGRDDGAGRCELEDGPYLGGETVRRLACDASLVRLVDGPGGEPLDIGRRSRSIPPPMRRALRARDGGCRFPGCTAARFVDGHHIRHWAEGGETRLDNLVQLCRHHHRLVHEGGYDVTVDPSGAMLFTRPDGEHVPTVPRPVPLPSGSDEIVAMNEQLGLDIDAKTAVTAWCGENMDYDVAIYALLQDDGLVEPAVPSRTRATNSRTP